MSETILGETKNGRLIVLVQVAGPNPYATGGAVITVASVGEIDAVLSITNEDGYKVEPGEATIAGNVITVPVRFNGYACTGAPNSVRGYEVLNGSSLAATTFSLIVIGQ
jgi:hypothetical protein